MVKVDTLQTRTYTRWIAITSTYMQLARGLAGRECFTWRRVLLVRVTLLVLIVVLRGHERVARVRAAAVGGEETKTNESQK